MSADDVEKTLDSAIADAYRGLLEDFVRRRDALAKELRSAGQKESASTVKALRKPSRIAWALDLAVGESPESVERLVSAVVETAGAQADGGDVRAAIGNLRTAVRDLAGRAARAAEQGGNRVEVGVLSNALFAVLGVQESFAQLRRGHLADVPEAGGLDLLTTLLAPVDLGSRPAPAKAPVAAAGRSSEAEAAVLLDATAGEAVAREAAAREGLAREAAAREGLAREAAAREALQQAALVLAAARERSTAAQEALRSAESKVDAAEARLRAAEAEARVLRGQRDRTRQDVDGAASLLLEAETAAADAERRLAELRAPRPA